MTNTDTMAIPDAEEAIEAERIESANVFERIDSILLDAEYIGRDYVTVRSILRNSYRSEDVPAIVAYLSSQPYSEKTFDTEWAIVAAVKGIA